MAHNLGTSKVAVPPHFPSINSTEPAELELRHWLRVSWSRSREHFDNRSNICQLVTEREPPDPGTAPLGGDFAPAQRFAAPRER